MTEINEYALPMAWWLFWWGVGLAGFIGLTIWFAREVRRADQDTEKHHKEQAGHSSGGSAH